MLGAALVSHGVFLATGDNIIVGLTASALCGVLAAISSMQGINTTRIDRELQELKKQVNEQKG